MELKGIISMSEFYDLTEEIAQLIDAKLSTDIDDLGNINDLVEKQIQVAYHAQRIENIQINVDTVESWNWNLSIFEIYDEVKDMGKFGYGGGQTEELSRLLNHAYEYFNYDSMIAELMSFLGVDIEECEEKELTESS